MHAGRTATTLAISARLLGVDRRRVGELLSRVGLERAAARSGSGSTRWACASGSGSRARCSAIRRS